MRELVTYAVIMTIATLIKLLAISMVASNLFGISNSLIIKLFNLVFFFCIFSICAGEREK